MAKFEGIRKFALDLFPKTPDAKILASHVDVVQENNSARLYFRQPAAEIVRRGFIGVKAINVQEIDTFIAEALQRIVELHPQQLRELPVEAFVVAAHLIENILAIQAGMGFSSASDRRQRTDSPDHSRRCSDRIRNRTRPSGCRVRRPGRVRLQ